MNIKYVNFIHFLQRSTIWEEKRKSFFFVLLIFIHTTLNSINVDCVYKTTKEKNDFECCDIFLWFKKFVDDSCWNFSFYCVWYFGDVCDMYLCLCLFEKKTRKREKRGVWWVFVWGNMFSISSNLVLGDSWYLRESKSPVLKFGNRT